jgi:hypothetical protein
MASRDARADSSLRRTLTWPGPALVDACCVRAEFGQLLALTEDGALWGVDLDSGAIIKRCAFELPDFAPVEIDDHGVQCYRLHASADGEYAAVVVDQGVAGVVVRSATGEVTLRLNGGDNYPTTVPFSACFVRHRGRDVLIHRTAWNRLDASDPATGQLLTARTIAPYETRKPRPAHYLDYFHGRLIPNPQGSRLFDDGWVWQPDAVPCAWSITDWLDANPYESEDGASRIEIMIRDDWDIPACWIDERQIALWGLSDLDEFEETGRLESGVRISDVTGGSRPAARKLPMPIEYKKVHALFSDGQRLFVATAESGASSWDIASGARSADFDGFAAHLHHRQRGWLIALAPDAIGVLNIGGAA